jgi:negative regulator of sigma-B (phosphoserine phosphatase)
MNPRIVHRPALVEWGVACYTLEGESECGDLHLVLGDEFGTFVSVVDGAGHGAKAASASRRAIATLEQYAQEGIIRLVRRCHEQLRGTRGVVMTLASFSNAQDEMTWLAVGNVQSVLFRGGSIRTHQVITLRGGLVGYRLPPLQAAVLPVSPGDLLILATDGIRPDFARAVDLLDTPQRIADRICAAYTTRSDDGLVLAVRYLGRQP